jgi:hypothetical protein
MKCYLLFLFALVQINIYAQIATPEIDKGITNTTVTDIVIVFKMHVDVG